MICPKIILSAILASIVVRVIEGGCYERVTIKNEDDLQNIITCPYLGVPLTISSDFVGKIIFPRLDETHSNITITGDKITEINLRKLTRTRTLSITDVPNLQSLQISNLLKSDNLILKNIGGVVDLNFINGLEKSNYIEISNCSVKNFNNLSIRRIENLKLTSLSGITRLEMPLLSSIEGTIEVRNLNDLEAIYLPKLKSIENDAIFASNPKARISLPVLEKVKSKLVFHTIKEINIPKLKEVKELSFENVASKINKSHNPYFVEKYLNLTKNDKLSNVNSPLAEELKEIVLPIEDKHTEDKLIPDLVHSKVLKTNASDLTRLVHNNELNKSISNSGALLNCENQESPNLLPDNCNKLVNSTNPGTSSVIQSANHETISKESKTSGIGSPNIIQKTQQNPSLGEQATSKVIYSTSLQNFQQELKFNEQNNSLDGFPKFLEDTQHKLGVKDKDFSTTGSAKITQNSQQVVSLDKQYIYPVLSSNIDQNTQQNLIVCGQDILPTDSYDIYQNIQQKPSTIKQDNPTVFSPVIMKNPEEKTKLVEQDLINTVSFNVQKNQPKLDSNEICFFAVVSPDNRQDLSPIVSPIDDQNSQKQSVIEYVSSTSTSKDFESSTSLALLTKPSFVFFSFILALFHY